MTDHLLDAQKAAEAHYNACLEALYDDEGDIEHPPDTLAPFCGCDTCIVREILHAAWPHLKAAALEERNLAIRGLLGRLDQAAFYALSPAEWRDSIRAVLLQEVEES